jgi:hypothetical protein
LNHTTAVSESLTETESTLVRVAATGEAALGSVKTLRL